LSANSLASVTAVRVTDKTGYSITANTDKTGYSITANNDKTGYSITANSDKAGYSITANSDKTNYSLTSLYDSAKTAAQQTTLLSVTASQATQSTDLSNIYTRIGLPVSGTISNDIANVASNVISGIPTNNLATTGVINNATNISGSYTATYTIDSTYWNVRPTGSPLDVELLYNVGSRGLASVYIAGRYTAANNRYVNIYAWNYITSQWDLITSSINRMNNSATDLIY
jgi:hypothetical protein